MVSYTKPKHGSTGKTKKQLRADKTKTGPRPDMGLPHHAAQSHDQPINFNMNRAKPVFLGFPREARPQTG
jgi:hypothetical protein